MEAFAAGGAARAVVSILYHANAAYAAADAVFAEEAPPPRDGARGRGYDYDAQDAPLEDARLERAHALA